MTDRVDLDPRGMRNCTLKTALSKHYKNLYALTSRGWEPVVRVRVWGADFMVITAERYFVEAWKYVLYRPNARQRKAIERKRN